MNAGDPEVRHTLDFLEALAEGSGGDRGHMRMSSMPCVL